MMMFGKNICNGFTKINAFTKFSILKFKEIQSKTSNHHNKYNKKSKNVVVIPLTSNLTKTDYDIIIINNNLKKGNLIVDGRAKINKIFSVEQKLIRLDIGKINKKTFSEMNTTLSNLIE